MLSFVLRGVPWSSTPRAIPSVRRAKVLAGANLVAVIGGLLVWGIPSLAWIVLFLGGGISMLMAREADTAHAAGEFDEAGFKCRLAHWIAGVALTVGLPLTVLSLLLR